MIQGRVRDLLSERHHFSYSPISLHGRSGLCHSSWEILGSRRVNVTAGRLLQFIYHSFLSTSEIFYSHPFLFKNFSHFVFSLNSSFCDWTWPDCLHSSSFSLIYWQGLRLAVSCDGGVWFPSLVIKETKPELGHTWSWDGIGFLQGPRAIPRTQTLWPQFTSSDCVIGRYNLEVSTVSIMRDVMYILHAVKLLLEGVSLQPGPPLWEAFALTEDGVQLGFKVLPKAPLQELIVVMFLFYDSRLFCKDMRSHFLCCNIFTPVSPSKSYKDDTNRMHSKINRTSWYFERSFETIQTFCLNAPKTDWEWPKWGIIL